MSRIILAFVIFLALVLSMATPATAQFAPSGQVYVISHQIDAYGQSGLTIFATRCTQNYQMFLSLSKRQDIGNGGWVDQAGLIPIGIEPLAPGVTVRRGLNLKLAPGTYKLSVTNLSRYGNADRNVKTTPCVSDLQNYAQTEDIIFNIGENQTASDGPLVISGDKYARLNKKEGETAVARFWGLFPSLTRLIVSQEKVDGTVVYSVREHSATPGTFQQISLELPNNFDDSLPVSVYAKDMSTNTSVSLEVLKSNPVVANSAATNR